MTMYGVPSSNVPTSWMRATCSLLSRTAACASRWKRSTASSSRRDLGPQDLDRDLLVQREVVRAVDEAHAATPDLLVDAVLAEQDRPALESVVGSLQPVDGTAKQRGALSSSGPGPRSSFATTRAMSSRPNGFCRNGMSALTTSRGIARHHHEPDVRLQLAEVDAEVGAVDAAQLVVEHREVELAAACASSIAALPVSRVARPGSRAPADDRGSRGLPRCPRR